jgi:hypothetical protein
MLTKPHSVRIVRIRAMEVEAEHVVWGKIAIFPIFPHTTSPYTLSPIKI